MSDEHRLILVDRAIRSGIMGNIEWKPTASELLKDDPETSQFTANAIRAMLRDFVVAGGRLDVRRESREEYADRDDPFWYRARIPIEGFRRPLFVELKIVDDEPEEPFVQIVSCHF